MFNEFINQILGSEREPKPNYQEGNTTPDTIEKSSVKETGKYKSDIEALKLKYGDEFTTGLCIEISLKELLEITPRERRRIDAYRGLISCLKTELGIILTIKSQKTK